MGLFRLLSAWDPDFEPAKCKVHLAGFNGEEHPLDRYREGRFDEWQSWQNRRNFERQFVVSLISMRQADRWLFAGLHEKHSRDFLGPKKYYYHLQRRPGPNVFDGRLIVNYKRRSRASYLLGEEITEPIEILEIRPEQLRVKEFSTYFEVTLSYQELNVLVQQQDPSWKSALGAVAGIYVIADTNTGKLYVGSASGDGGIWARWCSYVQTGHGQNVELKKLLREKGKDYVRHFQFGILEVADSHASPKNLLERESYWKNLLLTRGYGYNSN